MSDERSVPIDGGVVGGVDGGSMGGVGRLVPWFGSKASMASEIIDVMLGADGSLGPPLGLGDYDLYVEPFHGSLAMLLELRAWGYDGQAIVSDLNRLASNLAVCLADARLAADVWRIAAPFLHHEDLRARARAWLAHVVTRPDWAPGAVLGSPSPDPCPRTAAMYLIDGWSGRKGEHGLEDVFADLLGGFAVRWTPAGGQNSVEFRAAIESIPEWYRVLARRTSFLCRDGLEVLAELATPERDRPGVLVYADPPYLIETRGSARYGIEPDDGTGTFYEAGDFHARLAARLNALTRATVAVSYYAHARLAGLYPEADGWVHVDLTKHKATAHSSGLATREPGAGRNSPEVLIVRRGPRGGVGGGKDGVA